VTDTPAPARWLAPMLLADVAEAERNPKAHDADALGRSVDRFGYVEPMVLDERTGRLVAGHGRLADLRAREARGDTPPEGVAAGADGWAVPVLRGWHSRSDAEADAAGVALNRVGESGGWQADQLADLLTELAGDTDLLAATGFSTADLDNLLADLGDVVELPEQATDAEHAPLLPRGDPAEPRSVQGLHEVGLMFAVADHRRYLELLAVLRRVWSLDAAPLIVLRALAEAADAAADG
jgi:hypothetical protein